MLTEHLKFEMWTEVCTFR